jgi:ATP-dependent Clp protease ATP-binding subunit ClpB
MNGSQFTHKAQDAILAAQDLARELGQQQVDALHLLYALLNQEGSIVVNVLERLGVDVEALKRRTRYYLEKIPTIITPQTFGQFYLTQDMAKVLDVARQEMRKMGDEYISVEHLFLALLSTDTKAREVLEEARFIQGGGVPSIEFGKLDYQTFLKEVMKIRGGTKSDRC